MISKHCQIVWESHVFVGTDGCKRISLRAFHKKNRLLIAVTMLCDFLNEILKHISYQVDRMDVAILVFVIGKYLSQVSDVTGGQAQRVQLGEFGVRWNPR